jgi:hypothetical protein
MKVKDDINFFFLYPKRSVLTKNKKIKLKSWITVDASWQQPMLPINYQVDRVAGA